MKKLTRTNWLPEARLLHLIDRQMALLDRTTASGEKFPGIIQVTVQQIGEDATDPFRRQF